MKKILYFIILILFTISCSKTDKNEIHIIGTWGGSELNNFLEICNASGVKVKFETTRDLDALITTRIEANNTPDLAILPNPAKLQELAKKGKIKPLDFLNKEELLKSYSETWIDLASYGGKLFGIFYKASNKSVIWYNPVEFKKNGWDIPKTWDEMIKLTDKIRESGKTPWSIGSDIGWPLSDWIENIMIRTTGPEKYQAWIDHEIPWTDPCIKNAFMEWKKIIGNPKNLYGGIDGTLALTFQNAAFYVFQENPKAYMYYEGDFMGGIVANELNHIKFGENMAFFAFPPIKEEYGVPVVGGADVIAIFNTSKNVKKLLQFLTTKEAHEIWAKKGGFISHNKNVSYDIYPDIISKSSARILTEAKIYVFDASDMMPPSVGNQGGFWDACKRFIQNPDDIDKILADMENLAENNY